MRIITRLILGFLALLSISYGKFVEKPITYTIGKKTFSGVVTWEGSSKKDRPAIIMIPNWMGPTQASLQKAQMIAGKEFVVMMVDMYGIEIRPKNMDEASVAATTVRTDRSMMRNRVGEAIKQFGQFSSAPWDGHNIAAIGFCFGGGSVLEYARSGANDLQGVVSFHGNLDTPMPSTSIFKMPMLVLHGADDPFVPAEQVDRFQQEIADKKSDCTFVSFSGAVHSFTDPLATMKGKAEYDAVAAKRSFAIMRLYFQEWFTGKRTVPVMEKNIDSTSTGGFIKVQPGEAKRPGSMGKR